VGTWEALVDAATGGLLALEDKNLYQSSRTVVGGVYPSSNDGIGADGTEQAGFPMPYADVSADGATSYANGGGVAGCFSGDITTTLNGRYVQIADNCGAIDETSAGSLDLGTSSGTNCTVPGGHSVGDTHAARTTYYELNRLFEQGRGYLPDNEWLQQQVTANVNISPACNAFWNGLSFSFARAASGCANTGELASFVDHEWAHGLDNKGANPNISSPFEAFGYALTAFRQVDSCIGRGFTSFNCGGFGDPCLSCTGIEDVDYARHASNTPRALAWIVNYCFSGGTRGPCNREQFCESLIVGEAAWDLFARDLQAAPFNYDSNTALEIATRLFYVGGQTVDAWYQCNPSAGTGDGCAAGSGYLNLLAADDDDGNLGNGTPHMTAIFNAFNRHGIACSTPAVADKGCAGAPTTATVTLEVTPLDQAAHLQWKEVPDAARYAIYRTEGVNGCDFGKTRVGETTDTSFTDEGLLNDFAYHYMVLPLGAEDTCVGRMSACQTVTPVPGPNLAWDGASSIQLTTGDGDLFVDNCEVATARFTIVNNGGTPLTNVRIVGIAPATHPSTQLLDAPPLTVTPSLAICGTATGRVSFIPNGLSFDETMDLVVTFTADEFAPQTRTALLRYTHAESDFQTQVSRTYGFETGLDGWQVLEGIWTRQSTGGGAGGTAFYVRSSSGLNDQCDRIQSPLVTLSGASTLTLSTRYQIEPFDGSYHYDRANVALMDDAGERTIVSPDAGLLYTVPPGQPFVGCGLRDEPGWNGTNPGNPGFSASSWSPSALSAGGTLGGVPVRLDIAYATDFIVAMDGFRFDQVTLTNFGEQVTDVQTNTCGPVPTANVGIVKTDGQPTATPGAPISYTLTVTNSGPATLTSVDVQDALPAVLLSPVFTPSAGSYDPATGVWTGLSLAPTQSATLTLAATVSPSATGTLTNTAMVQPGPLTDPATSNNSSSDVDTLGPPDLIFENGFEP
jgi:uncharacterized repeat protein (TIGR01451 family)